MRGPLRLKGSFDMKEKFAKAVHKMKRKDFLDDFIREKSAEENRLTEEAAELRKKNGKKVGSDIDLRIFQINMRKAEIFKNIAKCKAEIKTLKTEILDLLTDCYALAEKPENKAKIESACYHAFEGKVKILSDKDAGGIMGDCKIVGAIITHDKKKRRTTAKLVKAGAKNSQGKLLQAPEIVVYDYDKKQEDGIYRDETNEFKKKLRFKKQNLAISYLKETYIQKNSLYALSVTAIYAVFALWSAIGGFGQAVFSSLQLRFSAVLITLLGLFSITTLKKGQKGGVCDIIPLTAIGISLVAFSCLFAYDILRGILFPLGLLIYGVTAIILRAKFVDEEGKNEENTIYFALSTVLGCLFVAVFKTMSSAYFAYWLTAICIIGVIAVLSAVGCVLNRGTNKVKIYKYTAIFVATFGFVCFLLGIKLVVGIIFFAVSVIESLLAIFAERENV